MGNIDISFCTTIKNRIHHLSRTLPINLKVLKRWSLKNNLTIEYLILDYDSTDGLKEWLPDFWQEEDYNFSFIRLENKPVYEDQIAKNIIHKAAQGNYLMNLDADNFLDELYLDKFYSLVLEGYDFISHSKYVEKDLGDLVGSFKIAYFSFGHPDVGARIAMKKEVFEKLGGYDEDLKGWGYTDGDIIARANEMEFKCGVIGPEYLSENSYISHDDIDRLVNRDQTVSKGVQNCINMSKSLKNIKSGKLRANT